jgi:acetyltransferase-like isoleucine patch superfamily enzyme
MVGAGSVVTRDVPAYGLVWGNPTRLHGFVCPCGEKLELINEHPRYAITTEAKEQNDVSASFQADRITAVCPNCSRRIEIDRRVWEEYR